MKNNNRRPGSVGATYLVLPIMFGLATGVFAGEIRGWRNDWTGVFPDADPPTSWGPGNHEVWCADLGGGLQSSPVLVGDRVITAVEPDKLICLRASDGQVLWKTSNDLWKNVLSPAEAASARTLAAEADVWKREVDRLDDIIGNASLPMSATQLRAEYRAMTKEQRQALVAQSVTRKSELLKQPPAGLKWVNMGGEHAGGGMACATPVTDGRFAYYVFGNGLGVCCEVETGKRLWYTKLAGEAGYQHHGLSGSSPALAGDRVILRFGDWLYGLNTRDGSQVWAQREPERWTRRGATTFSTAVVVTIDGTAVVVTQSGQFLRASDGKMLADLDLYGAGSEMIATPVVDHGVIYLPVPNRRLSSAWTDVRPAFLLAVRLPARITGDVLQPTILWKTTTTSANTGSSPVVFNGLLFIRDEVGSRLRAFDVRDGSLVFEKDLADYLKDVGNAAYGSLTVAGGNLYVNSSMVDRTVIIKAGREYSEVARNERGIPFQETRSWMKPYGMVYASNPVFSGKRMYWRENSKMYCFAKDAPPGPSKTAGAVRATIPPDSSSQPPVTPADRLALSTAAIEPPVRSGARAQIPSAAWPCSDGPSRDGASPETSLFAHLKQGPVVVWKASLGTGYTSIAISNGLVYAAGNRNDKDIMAAFDAITGKPIWTYGHDEPLAAEGFAGGPCATPTIAGGRIYSFSRSGRVNCLDAASGSPIWHTDLAAEVGPEAPHYGYAGSPTVVGQRLYLNAGSGGCCLDAATGTVLWKSPGGRAGYSAPVPFPLGARHGLLIFSGDALLALDAATGQTIMKYPWKDMEGATAPTPLLRGTQVFISSGFAEAEGGVLLDTTGGVFKEVWRTANMSSKYGGGVVVDGFLYGFDATTLRCLDWRTGKARWEQDGFGDGTLVTAGGRLIILSETGDLVIAEARPDAFHEVIRGHVLKPSCWTRPAISGGRIYCRNADGDLVCVELR